MTRLITELAFLAIAALLILNAGIVEHYQEQQARVRATEERRYSLAGQSGYGVPHLICFENCVWVEQKRHDGRYRMLGTRGGRIWLYHTSPTTMRGTLRFSEGRSWWWADLHLSYYEEHGVWFGTDNHNDERRPLCLTEGAGDEAELRCRTARAQYEKGTL